MEVKNHEGKLTRDTKIKHEDKQCPMKQRNQELDYAIGENE